MPLGPPFHLSLPTIQAIVAVGDRPPEQRSIVRRFGQGLQKLIKEGLSHAVPGPVDMVAPTYGGPPAETPPPADPLVSPAAQPARRPAA